MSKSKATDYAEAVLDGEIVANEYIKLACQRHLDDLGRVDLQWDAEEEARLHEFFPRATQHTKPANLAGHPIELAGHQSFYFGQLRCWLKKDGAQYRHRFRRGLMLSGRGGAGKTASFAGLVLYYLLILNDRDPMPEVYITAQEHRQCYDGMDSLWLQIQRSEELEPLFRRQIDHGHTLLVRTEETAQLTPTNCTRIALSPKSGSGVRGAQPSLLIVEEAQSVTDTAKLNDLEYGARNRPHSATLWFGNAGHDLSTPLGVLFTEAQESLRDQREFDDSFLPCLFMSDRGEDLLDEADEVIEEEVRKSNPLYPVSPASGWVWDEVRSAQKNPVRKNEVLNQIFGVWTAAATAWLPAEVLFKAETPEPPQRGARLFLGLDLSKSGDMSAVGEYWETGEGGLLKGHCWLPRGGMEERSKADQARFNLWAGESPASLDGPLTITPGWEIDYGSIAEYVARILDSDVELVGMACDASYMRSFRDALTAAQVDFCTQADQAQPGQLILVHHPQGISGLREVQEYNKLPEVEQQKRAHAPLWMPRSLEATEKGLLEGDLLLEKQPLMRWTMESVELAADTVGNRYVVRKPSTGGMIDLAVACIMARGLADAWLDHTPPEQNFMEVWIGGMKKELANG